MSASFLLELKNISKNFGGVRALHNVDLTLGYKEILAVVGDNGAGKSTLMKVVSGALMPDAGSIFFEGKKVNIKSPKDSLGFGIQMCYQDLALINCLDIQSNLFMGREISRKFLGRIHFLDKKRMRHYSNEHLKSLGINIPYLREKVGNLSGGQRQVIAISRAVYWGKKLIILDEPTAALGVQESGKVLNLIRTLKNKNERGFFIPVIVAAGDKGKTFFSGFSDHGGLGNPVMFFFTAFSGNPVAQGPASLIDNHKIASRLQRAPYTAQHLSGFGKVVIDTIHVDQVN